MRNLSPLLASYRRREKERGMIAWLPPLSPQVAGQLITTYNPIG